MPTPPLSPALALQALEAFQQFGESQAAADAIGIPRSTFVNRLKAAQRIGAALQTSKPDFTMDELPSELPTADELLERRTKQFARKAAAVQARALIPVNVALDGPIGIVHFGDPHVDDDGTDITLLKSHVEIVKKTEGLFAGNVGDYSNNWVGRLARLYGQQTVSAAESWVLVEWLIRALPWLYLVGGNHDCHDAETECLTRRGWVRYSELSHDDHVLSFDTATKRSIWSPIIQKIVRHHSGEMIESTSPSLKFKVTPNHRVLCRGRHGRAWGEWGYRTADSLPAQFGVPVSADSRDEQVALSDEQIALAGWVLTDGSIAWDGNSPRVSIYQSKDTTAITRLLDGLGLKYRHAIRDRRLTSVCGRALVKPAMVSHEFTLTADSSREVLAWLPEKGHLPEWSHRLSGRQFSVLLDALVAGDGCWDGRDPGAKTVAVIHGTKTFLESVQAVAVQHGWRARLAIARGKDYRLNLCKAEAVSVWAATKRVQYDGEVWCLTVPLGNFMVRRNGAAHFSGNCWSGAGDPIQWMAKSARVQYEANGMRLGLTFPNGRVIRVNARHDFSGRSQWNTAHGPAKAAQMGWRDHILTCGHTHVSGYNVVRDPSSGLLSHALRVSSYKTFDRYAEEKGLPNQSFMVAPVTIIDPDEPDDSNKCVTVIFDPAEAAEYLTWKRKRWARKRA